MCRSKIKIGYLIALAALVVVLGVMGSMALTGGKTAEGQSGGVSSDPAYIKFDGVDGESQDKDHMGWSDLVSFDQAIHSPSSGATGATRRRGDVVLEDIRITKQLDKASPKLAEAVCKGKVFPKVEIHLTASYADAGKVTYYAYELTNVLVTSYAVGSSTMTDDMPMEDVSLNFEEIKVTYTETDSTGKTKGNVEYSWKVEEAEP